MLTFRPVVNLNRENIGDVKEDDLILPFSNTATTAPAKTISCDDISLKNERIK